MPAIPPPTAPASAYELVNIAPAVAPPIILADAIDPATGDFASLTRGADLATAFAVHAVRTQHGTGSAVRDTGNRYHELTHVEENIAELVQSHTEEAFADAARAGIAELVEVTIEVDPGDPSQVNTVVDFRDLLAPPGEEARRLTFTR